MALAAAPCGAQEAGSDAERVLESRHRLDFTLVYLDSVPGRSLNGEFAYTHNFTANTNLSAAITYQDSNLDQSGDSGLGDTTLTFAWTPMTPLSAGPWVPRQVGTGISVVLPTGDESKGLGSGATIIMPSLGFAYALTERFHLFPSAWIGRSIGETAVGEHFDIGVADFGAGWLLAERYWMRLYVAWIKDFESRESYFNSAFSLGMLISARWGASLVYDRTDFFIPGITSTPGLDADGQLLFNLHYNF